MMLQPKTPKHSARDCVIGNGAHHGASNHAAANNSPAARHWRDRARLQPHGQEPVDHPTARGDRPDLPAILQAERGRRPAMGRRGGAGLARGQGWPAVASGLTRVRAPPWKRRSPPRPGRRERARTSSKRTFAMRNIATAPLRGQASPRPDAMAPSDQLHRLAREVERLAVGGRTDPETILLAKYGIAGELRRLAREIGR